VQFGRENTCLRCVRSGLTVGSACQLCCRMCRWEGLRRARLIELQATHQLLVYTRHTDLRGGNVHTVKTGVDGVLVASKEGSIVVTAGKT
jgi:hypothetical protein